MSIITAGISWLTRPGGGILGGITAAAFVPLSVATGTLVNAAFKDLPQGSLTSVANFLAEGMTGGSVNTLQTSSEIAIELFVSE